MTDPANTARPEVQEGDFLDLHHDWPDPVVIISDGPYGLSNHPGDPNRSLELPAWYEPHVEAWTQRATPLTTLWFWCTELGWALVHPILNRHGWTFRGINVWDKGLAHVAGNSNTGTLRQFPVVTEVCVQYTRPPALPGCRTTQPLQEWLREEWRRTGLPMSQANLACGVRNAATRKYLTPSHHWYFPPPEPFRRMVQYANEHGDPRGRPYFIPEASDPGEELGTPLRAKFHCPLATTNVWSEPAVRGPERLRERGRTLHPSQKPLRLFERIILASSDPGDVVWEPFGGTATGAVASINTGRRCYTSESNPHYHRRALDRIRNHAVTPKLI